MSNQALFVIGVAATVIGLFMWTAYRKPVGLGILSVGIAAAGVGFGGAQ